MRSTSSLSASSLQSPQHTATWPTQLPKQKPAPFHIQPLNSVNPQYTSNPFSPHHCLCLRPCSPARLNRPPTQRTLQTGAIERSERLSIAYFKIGFKCSSSSCHNSLISLKKKRETCQAETAINQCGLQVALTENRQPKAFRLFLKSWNIYLCWLKRKLWLNLENGMILARSLASS